MDVNVSQSKPDLKNDLKKKALLVQGIINICQIKATLVCK